MGSRVRDPSFLDPLQRRGGGEVPTYTSVLSGPPSSTLPPHKDFTVGGSTGGFIGLVSGIAIFLVLALILVIYLWNRFYRRRIGSKRRSIRDVIPSLSFSGPTPDPYASPASPGEAPDNRFYPSRPGMRRDISGTSEWELQSDAGLSTGDAEEGYGGGSGKGKARAGASVGGSGASAGYMGMGMGLPTRPDEAALPIRSRSPSARSVSEWSNHSAQSGRSGGGRWKGKDRLDVNTAVGNHHSGDGAGSRANDTDALGSDSPVNPFDSPHDREYARSGLVSPAGSEVGLADRLPDERRRSSGASDNTLRSPPDEGGRTGVMG